MKGGTWMRWKRIACGAAALSVLVGGLSGCGNDKKPVALTVKASSSGGKLAFNVPKEIDGGVVALTLDNVDKQPHELAMVRVDPGIKPQQVIDEFVAPEGAPIPSYVHEVVGVGNAAPGKEATATQVVPAGNYVYFCTFGDGDAVHYKHGMLGAVTVKGDKGKGDLPDSTESIAASEYTFAAKNLKAGTHKLLFKNDGKQYHHAQLFPIAKGSTFDDVKAFLASDTEPTGPPPVDFEKGTGTMVQQPGGQQVTDVTLVKGDYVVLCFLSDKTGGPPHFLKGMVKQVTVS
jgi:plastocyanin